MTLKRRVLVAMALVAGLLVVAAWTVTRTMSSYLLGQLDEQLVRVASGPSIDDAGMPPPSPGRGPYPGSFSSVYVGSFVDGVLETRVVPARGATPDAVPRISEDRASALAAKRTLDTVGSTASGTRYRVLVRADPGGGLVLVGLPLDDVDATVGRLVVVELVATGVVLAVLALVAWWVLRLGVRPVRRMTVAATTIAAGDLSHRVPEEAPGTEAHDLGVALNAMLERIEAAFAERTASEQRLRRFVADASHELRTPVTTIRGYAELHRLGGLEDPGRLDAAMARTEAEAIRMGGLVEDLLTLTRIDRGEVVEPGVVELEGIVSDAVDDFRVRHPEHPLTADITPVAVIGDADRLHQVVANLLTNAAVHTPAGTAVEVQVSAAGDRARLVVRDHGPGIEDEAAEKAFERFWRADVSRSRASGGSGLGLSIVAAIVGSLGGSVRLDRPSDGVGVAAVVDLPAV